MSAAGPGFEAPGAFLREHGPAAIDWAASYLERVGSLPVLARVAPGDVAAALPAACPETGEGFEAVLADLDAILLPGTTHWQHPRYFAYFPSTTSEPAILAELLAATLNTVSILWRTAPAATELEAVVCRWVAGLLGLPDAWHGHIEDSASTGTLAAAIAARTATGRGVLACSEQTHSSAEKAARMLEMELRVVPCDAAFRMDVSALGGLDDVAMLVATVGTTASGAVDPVPELAARCAGAGTWLHVDAAYAGTAMACEEFRWAFDGVALADSLVVNAHKWMLTPMDCSLLFSRRPDALRAAFSLVPEYLRTPDAEDALSLSEYGPALGRRNRALKLWAVLRCYGRSGLMAHVRRGVSFAAAFEGWVRSEDGWEVVGDRHFGLVCFRLVGGGGRGGGDGGGEGAGGGAADSGGAERAGAEDARNRALLEAVNASGEAFLSHAALAGRYTLRLAVGGPLTTLADVERTWALLRETAASL